MMPNNRRKKMMSQGFLLGLTLFTVVSFNNCGQPGAVNLQSSTAQLSTDIQSGAQFISKQMDIDVTTTTNKKIDVLVVIDNSGSMQTEQANMAQRFNTFIDQLNGLDWQAGIVTTDVSGDSELKDGRLISFSGGVSGRVITSAMDINVVKDSFAQTIQRPETGSGYEQGIAASYRAVERSRIAGSSNATLFRADAALAIVIITDANETAKVWTDRNDPAKLLGLIKGIWPQKSVNIHSIIVKSGDSSCLAKDGNESYGTVYESASASTGGVVGTVCATDYSSQLTLIGQTSAALVNTITLDCAPVDADDDGEIDIEIRDPSMNLITDFTIQGVQVKLGAPLDIGRTTVSYNCAK